MRPCEGREQREQADDDGVGKQLDQHAAAAHGLRLGRVVGLVPGVERYVGNKAPMSGTVLPIRPIGRNCPYLPPWVASLS